MNDTCTLGKSLNEFLNDMHLSGMPMSITNENWENRSRSRSSSWVGITALWLMTVKERSSFTGQQITLPSRMWQSEWRRNQQKQCIIKEHENKNVSRLKLRPSWPHMKCYSAGTGMVPVSRACALRTRNSEKIDAKKTRSGFHDALVLFWCCGVRRGTQRVMFTVL